MSLDLPFISCLCPTFRRPRLLENAIACFLAQDYPASSRELVILDDAGQIPPQHGAGWRVSSIPKRFDSLPEKYNALAGLAVPEATLFVVWEDDDIYLPWHLAAHAQALGRGEFSKPSVVLTLCTERPKLESAAGRFHASIGFTRTLYERVGGWPVTRRADFDLQFLARLAAASDQMVDPCDSHAASYVFRWGSTAAYHGQGYMRSPDDTAWYDQVPPATHHAARVDRLNPRFDRETEQVLQDNPCGLRSDRS